MFVGSKLRVMSISHTRVDQTECTILKNASYVHKIMHKLIYVHTMYIMYHFLLFLATPKIKMATGKSFSLASALKIQLYYISLHCIAFHQSPSLGLLTMGRVLFAMIFGRLANLWIVLPVKSRRWLCAATQWHTFQFSRSMWFIIVSFCIHILYVATMYSNLKDRLFSVSFK